MQATPQGPDDILDPWLGPLWKGWPHHAGARRRSTVAAAHWNVLAGDLPLPLAVIRRERLDGNLRWMQQFAQGRGVDLAPHGKTTMSPQLFSRQLDAGAWGLTFASATQARVGLAAGARRLLIANQVLAAADLAAVAEMQATGARVLFLIDSLPQLELIDAWHAGQPGATAPFEVLLEIGLDGGRTGCRHHDQALALARRLRASAGLRLVGIECYEGLWATGRSADDKQLAQGLMQRVDAIARACDDERLFECDEVLVSAGGSAIFDLVAAGLTPALSRPVRGLLRSGCYITHDHGNYRRYMSAMDTRLACGHGLQAALEVWATVQSCPEPGLAIVAAGKRDLSYDLEMPVPVRWCRHGERAVQAADGACRITALNDQHAYLRVGADAAMAPAVGDRVALGISHPCTTFDKWRWMAVVDDAYDVVDAIVTHF